MNTHKGETERKPRRKEKMLDRAVKYAKLYNNGKGMTAEEIGKQVGENSVTIYKLIRMGNAPRSIHSLIRKGLVPATTVSNLLKSSMTDKEMIEVVNDEIQKRNDAIKKLEDAGFRGASSMTARRAITLAINNLKKRHLIKGEGQKMIVRCLTDIFGKNTKPSIEDVESAILMH